MPTATSAAPTATHRARVFAGIAAGCIVSFNIGKIPSTLPALTEHFSLNLSQSGLVISLFSLLTAIFGIAAGLVTSRLGLGRTLLVALALTCIANVAGALAESFAVLLVSRTIEGMGWLLTAVSVPALLTENTSARQRSLILGIWGAFVPAGMILALASAPLALQLDGWSLLWWLNAAASALMLMLCWWLFDTSSPAIRVDRSPRPTASLGPLASLAHRQHWFAAGSFLNYSALFVLATAFIPTLLLDRFGVDPATASWWLIPVVAGNVIGNITAGALVRQGSCHRRILILATAGMGVSAALIYLSNTAWAQLLAATACTTIGGLIPGTLFAASSRIVHAPSQITGLMAMFIQCAGIGQLAGPLLLTLVVEGSGHWQSGVIPCIALGLAGFILATRLRPATAED